MVLIRNWMRFFGVAGAAGLVLPFAMASGSKPGQESLDKSSMAKRLANAQSNFAENVGQWNKNALFLARGKGHDFWVTRDGATFDFYVRDLKTGVQKGQVVRMSYAGASTNLRARGVDTTANRADYFRGGVSAKASRSFREVMQEDVYSGVDVRYYVDGGKPRYDFMVEPNADASQIRVKFSGAKVAAEKGGLVFATSVGKVRHQRPIAFQNDGIKRIPVSANYVALADGTFGIQVGRYDKSRELIIDPLVYGSYYGGDGGNDEVRAIVADTDGGVFLGGATQATAFPALAGPYSFNLTGGRDAFVAKLQGDAYSNIYAAYYGGSLDEFIQHLQLDPYGNLWAAGTYRSSDLPGNTRPNVQFIRFSSNPTGGTWRLVYGGGPRTRQLPFNVTPAALEQALEEDIPALGDVTVQSTNGGLLSNGSTYRIQFDPTAPFNLTGIMSQTGNPATNGLEAKYVLTDNNTLNDLDVTVSQAPNTVGSLATGGSYTLTFTNLGVGLIITIPFNTPTAALVTFLNANLPNLNGGTFTGTGGTLPGNPMRLVFNSADPTDSPTMTLSNTGLTPVAPNLVVSTFTDLFVIRWRKDAARVLDPGQGWPEAFMPFGGDGNETLAGFGIVQNDNPGLNDPIVFGFAGESTNALSPGLASGTAAPSGTYVARFRYDGTTFTQNATGTKFLEGTLPQNVGGFAIDRNGIGYVAGQVNTNANSDNPGNQFPVLNTFLDGDKLRRTDMFVRKYTEDGTMLYSNLLGGNGVDRIGGIEVDPYGVRTNTGSAIAVDGSGNAYVTGVASSFNYPRTRGVYGETFSAARVVVVTKISPDGKNIVYSTNLRTRGNVNPAGIAVDAAGNAFVSGNLRANFVDFPPTNGQQPGDPNEPVAPPTGYTLDVPLTGDALDNVYDQPAFPIFPTTEGFLHVLNPTATQLVFGTYIGGILDEQVYGPYVDRFGDVWVMGHTDFSRNYIRVSSTGTVNDRSAGGGGLPAALISPLAFKASADGAATGSYNLVYGGYGDRNGNGNSPATVPVSVARDGFLIKVRVGNTPNITSINLNPSTIPGGLGASSTATVTLSSPAPAGGADVELTISNTAIASFAPTTTVGTTVISIPAGATTGATTVYSRGVSANSSVQIRATYLGSFVIGQLNVVPWLQAIGLTPNDIIGGNTGDGRITLAAPAPAGGVSVTLSTDTPSLVSFPNGSTVTVPAGQTSATFRYATNGVSTTTSVTITGSAEGVNRTAALTLRTANLASLRFNPTEIAGLGSTVGTLTLDGSAGSTFTVNLTMDGNPSGYTFPSTLTFNAGESSKTFTVTAPIEPSAVARRVVATRPAQGSYLASSTNGVFTVLVSTVKSLTLNPTTVNAGGTSTATIELTSPAPDGGVSVTVTSSDTNVATVPTTVIVPAGSATATFTVQAAVNATQQTATITAARTAGDSKSATLTVRAGQFGLAISPGSVLGGRTNATGTVTLEANAGPLGVTINLSSNDSSITVPATVTVPAGQRTATFPVNSSIVSSTRTVVVTASTAGFSTSANIVVRANGLASMTVSPSRVRGGQAVSVTITLEDVAQSATTVTLAATNANLFTSFPTSRTIAAGQRSVTFTLITRRVSRDSATTLTATTAGTSASASLVVTR